MDFLGIKNVNNAEAIIGKDGNADGFKVFYTEERPTRFGVKTVEKMKTVWVREPEPVDDGFMHGFGNPTVYKKTTAKPKVEKTKKKVVLTKEQLIKFVGKKINK